MTVMKRNTAGLGIALIVFGGLLTGCSASQPRHALDAGEKPAPSPGTSASRGGPAGIAGENAQEYRKALEKRMDTDPALRRAYEQGVRDVLEDYKGRMRATQHYVYEPPVRDCIQVDAEIKDGAYYPARTECVIYRPGQFVERNGIRLPERGNRGGNNAREAE